MDCPLLALSVELRTKVYEYLLDSNDTKDPLNPEALVKPGSFTKNQTPNNNKKWPRAGPWHVAILRTCHQCYEEAAPILYATKTFSANDAVESKRSLYDQIIPNIPARQLGAVRSVKLLVHKRTIEASFTQTKDILTALPGLQTLHLTVDLFPNADHGAFLDDHGLFLAETRTLAEAASSLLANMAKDTLPSHPHLAKIYQHSPKYRVCVFCQRNMRSDGSIRSFVFTTKKAAEPIAPSKPHSYTLLLETE